jgi:Uma2 family endonuclease
MNAVIGTTKTKTLPESNNGKEIYYPSTIPNYIPESNIHFLLVANLVLMLNVFLNSQKGDFAFGDLMFYYEEGNPRKFVAPDVMISFNLEKMPTRVYKLWDEKVVPAVIVEIASDSTWDKDLTTKLALYQRLGVSEYYIFDVEYKCLRKPLMAFRLVDFVYEEVEMENNRVFSPSLGLELVDTGETLRLFCVESNQFLLTQEEMNTRQQELDSKQLLLEKENAELKAELTRLKQTK